MPARLAGRGRDVMRCVMASLGRLAICVVLICGMSVPLVGRSGAGEGLAADGQGTYTQPASNREKRRLNTGWKSYRGSLAADAAKEASYDDTAWQDVNLPHNPPMKPPDPDPLRPTWPKYSYEGVSWYRRHLVLDPCDRGKKVFVEFEAANTVTDVWINGVQRKIHYGGYLPFVVDLTDYLQFGLAGNVLAVRVDNTDNPDVPIGNSGWFNWGGIYRNVWLHVTDRLHVTDAVYAGVPAGGGIFVTTPAVTAAEAQVQIKTQVRSEYTNARDCELRSSLVDSSGRIVAQADDDRTIPAMGDFTFTQQLGVTDPCLWHPSHPNLYTLYCEVYDGNTCVDVVRTRVGIRRIGFSKSEGFKINGERLVFMGANRMQDYPYLGYAVGDLSQRRDAVKLKEAGFQYIRTSQYPQAPAFLDACDELGLMVLAPIPGFQYVGGETFKNHSYQDMKDLIRRDRNHPCVIAWELSLNETNFDSTYAKTAVAIGHAEYPGDQCFVAGWQFPSIYDVFIATPTAGARTYAGPAPLIISEYGHWEYGGNPSTSDSHRAADLPGPYKGGEAAMLRQASNHRDGLNLNRGMPHLAGDGLWCGIDLACYPSGALDTFRLPKFSYYFFQSQRDPGLILPGLDSGPMVFIANTWTAASTREVRVFSNCQQVRLYVNDVLKEVRTPDTGAATANLLHPPFTFADLTFERGQLRAEGLINGRCAAVHGVRTTEAAAAISVRPDVANVPANGSETVFVYASVVDVAGTVVPTAADRVTFSLTGPASLESPATVRAEAGIATALVRVSDRPGQVVISAAAPGLAEGQATLAAVPAPAE